MYKRQVAGSAELDRATRVWASKGPAGSTYVALFNLGEEESEVGATWADLGLTGKLSGRDLWERRDAGTVEGRVSAILPPHGSALLKLSL